MSSVVAITRQWQIHIPKWVRDAIGLDKPGQAKVEVRGKKIVITPKESEIMKLAGSIKHVKPTKKIDIDNIRDYIDYSNL